MNLIPLLAGTSFLVINKTIMRKIGINAAILISELASEYTYWDKKQKLKDDWFSSSIQNVNQNTNLSRYQQDEAISRLSDLGIIEMNVNGMPAKRYFRINQKNLQKLIEMCDDESIDNRFIEEMDEETAKNTVESISLQETYKQDCEKLANKNVKNSQTSLQKTDNQVCEKLAPNNNNKIIIDNSNNLTPIVPKGDGRNEEAVWEITPPSENAEPEEEKLRKTEAILQGMMDTYNTYCFNLPRATVLSETRKRAMRKYLDNFSLKDWKDECIKANESAFLTGTNDRGWMANIDFLLRTNQAQAIIEQSKFQSKKKTSLDTLAELYQEYVENGE